MKPKKESSVHLNGDNECKLLIQIFSCLPDGKQNTEYMLHMFPLRISQIHHSRLVFGMQNGKLFKKEEK